MFLLKTRIVGFYEAGGKYEIPHKIRHTPSELVPSSLIKNDLNTRLSVLAAPVGLGIESQRV